jgi:hypothetical protein
VDGGIPAVQWEGTACGSNDGWDKGRAHYHSDKYGVRSEIQKEDICRSNGEVSMSIRFDLDEQRIDGFGNHLKTFMLIRRVTAI